MSIGRLLPATILAVATVWASGCCGPEPKITVSLGQLLREHNANARKVPRLWARARIELKLVTEEGTFRRGGALAAPGGYLFLAKGDDPLGPHDFVLVERELGNDLFRIGNSLADGLYYFWYHYGSAGGGVYGRTSRAGESHDQALPLDPLQLLSALTVCELPSGADSPPGRVVKLPAVAMTLDDNDACRRAYVVSYIDRRPATGQLGFRREVYYHWDDRKPRRAFLVKFFDHRGRRVMEARLGDYRSIAFGENEQPPAGDPPVMPTDIEIRWLRTGSRLRIVLSEMTTEQRFDRDVFLLWDNLPGGMDRSSLTPVDAPPPNGADNR